MIVPAVHAAACAAPTTPDDMPGKMNRILPAGASIPRNGPDIPDDYPDSTASGVHADRTDPPEKRRFLKASSVSPENR